MSSAAGYEPVDHPAHYQLGGVEVIDLVEALPFNRGNAIKYLARAGAKPGVDELEDLRKAAWYVQREIDRLDPTPACEPDGQAARWRRWRAARWAAIDRQLEEEWARYRR